MLKFYTNRITRAFTLVESLVSLSIISGIASVGYVGFIEIKASSKGVKLEQDVAVVNNALNIYKAHGGVIDSRESFQNILDKLKTVPSDESIKEIIGLRDSMIDQRLSVVMQSDKGAKSSEPRALWDFHKKKFKISRSGKKGIKAFIIDPELLIHNKVKENRNSNLKLAKHSKWVWDYKDHISDLGENILPVSLLSSDSLTDRESDGYQGALKLNMPSLNIVGGKYPLLDFEKFSLSISNPNPKDSSRIFYTTNGNQWLPYSGESITVNPGDTIAAMSASLEPRSWLDSGTSVNTYKANPVELELRLSARDNPVDYRMMGGQMVKDSNLGRVGSEIFVSLHNNDQIPKRFIDPEKFNIVWSLDDTRDFNFREGNVVNNFSKGYGETSISHSISNWEGKNNLSVNVVAKSLEPLIFNDSKISSVLIGINKLRLEEPISDVSKNGDIGNGTGISLIPLNKSGVLPEGWRIYYTTNGIDPGTDQFGEPLYGDLYTSPIVLESSDVDVFRIKARVYGPEGYSNWFSPSMPKMFSFNRWNVPEWDGYIGGVFHKRTVASYFNIRQHKIRGGVDPTFNPEQGLNGIGRAIALQKDGKVIVGGEFTTANGIKSNRIVRFDSNGKVDKTFSTGDGFDDDVLAIAVQPDGKIVVGGKFQKFNGEYRMGLARLNNDGSIDQNFNVGRGVHTDQNGWVHGLAIQKKGWSNTVSEPKDSFKIIVAGCFTRYDNFPAFSLARIHLNGQLDMSFDTSLGVQGIVHGLCVQDDGGIIIGGNFEKYDGVKRKNVARVKAGSGEIDRSFDPGSGTSSPVYTVNSYRNGKIFIGGSFKRFNEIDVSSVARLLVNGSYDESFHFNNEVGYKNWTVHSSCIDAGENIYIGGELIVNEESVDCRPFIKLGVNGKISNDYIPEKLRNGSAVYAITERSNGRSIITGKFPEFYTKKTENIARINTKTGSLDQSFDIGVGADGKVNVVKNLSDGNSIVAGKFTSINNVGRNYIAKVSPVGEVLNFTSKVEGGEVTAVAEQPDGKIVIGGAFTSVEGNYNLKGIARLNPDGSVDETFVLPGEISRRWVQGHPWKSWIGSWQTDSSSGFDGSVESIKILADKSILVCGGFRHFGNFSQPCIALLNENGTLNNRISLSKGNIPSSGVAHDSLILKNGSIYIVGDFPGKIMRFNKEGQLDSGFYPDSIDSVIRSVALGRGGKIIIAGKFNKVGGRNMSAVAFLNQDGTCDVSFQSRFKPDGDFFKVLGLPSGGAVLVGGFTKYGDIHSRGIVKLKDNGEIDDSFGDSDLEVTSILTSE